jgi:GTP-binding protein
MFKEQDTEEEERLPFRKRPRPTARTARLPKGLKAITSSKPGETRTLNFYQISSLVKTEDKKKKVSLLLVDLPGYGFAYATQNKMEGWKSLMQDYILNRGKPLKRILFLLDARHGMKKADLEFMESLQTALYDKQHDGKSSKVGPLLSQRNAYAFLHVLSLSHTSIHTHINCYARRNENCLRFNWY